MKLSLAKLARTRHHFCLCFLMAISLPLQFRSCKPFDFSWFAWFASHLSSILSVFIQSWPRKCRISCVWLVFLFAHWRIGVVSKRALWPSFFSGFASILIWCEFVFWVQAGRPIASTHLCLLVNLHPTFSSPVMILFTCSAGRKRISSQLSSSSFAGSEGRIFSTFVQEDGFLFAWTLFFFLFASCNG